MRQRETRIQSDGRIDATWILRCRCSSLPSCIAAAPQRPRPDRTQRPQRRPVPLGAPNGLRFRRQPLYRRSRYRQAHPEVRARALGFRWNALDEEKETGLIGVKRTKLRRVPVPQGLQASKSSAIYRLRILTHPISSAPGVSRPMSLIWSLLMPCAISSLTNICRPSACEGLPACPRSVPKTKFCAPTSLIACTVS